MKSLNVKRKIFLFLQFQMMFAKTSAAVCPFAMDLAFLMDASGSIGPHNYENMKKFINEVIDHFHVSSKGTHVGVVSFSSVARTEISFTDQQNVEKIKAAVSNISYYKGGTDLDEGLQESREKLFSAEHGMRANVPHVLLAFTDGISGKGIGVTKQESQHLKDDGIVIFAMGIGDNVNSAEIHALASDSSRVFQVTSTKHMLQAGYSLKIALALCSANRTSNAIIFPVVTQHSLKHHIVASRTTYDDLGCALMCIKHSSCYSFNFHTPSRLCELSYARKTDFPGDFYNDHGSVYSELDFEREV